MIARVPLHYPAQAFHERLQSAVAIAPECVAVHTSDRAFTYREIDGASNAFARALRDHGVSPGDRVAVVCGTRIEWVIAVHAVSILGAASVLMNPNWKSFEMDHALGVTRPVAVIADRMAMETLDGAAFALRVALDARDAHGALSFWDLVMSNSGERLPDLSSSQLGDDAMLLFSSGTTGLPKAVRHTHRTLAAAMTIYRSAARITDQDRIQLFLPVFHIFGPSTFGTAFEARAPMWLLDRFDPHQVLEQIERERITIAFAAAPVALALARLPDLERFDLSSLRYMLWGATPVNTDIAAKVTSRSGIRWVPAYGATEAPLMFMNPVESPQDCRLDSPGIAGSDVEARIVDLQSGHDVGPGETGEILVRSPQVMVGYLPDSANAESLIDGWYRTGDVGSIDADGWVQVVDRVKEMIKVSGFQVAPAELEAVLLQHPGIADCGVVGLPDDLTGEAPVAVVVPRDALDPEEVRTWIAERLVTYKQLRRVVIAPEIPRTPAGKILRRVLKDQLLG